MLKTLLESNAKRQRNQAITAASVMVHAIVIIVAAFATVAGAAAEDEGEAPTRVFWTTPKPSPVISGHRTIKPLRLGSPVPVSLPAAPFSIEIPSTMPALTVSLAPITGADFEHSSGAERNGQDTPGNSVPGGTQRAYTSSEVEVPVSVLGGARPDYPAALRSSGMEGQVVAQFIVDESGRGIPESVNILSATNDLFAEAVRRAIPKMRFAAARIGTHAVPQLVQQLFVFRLN